MTQQDIRNQMGDTTQTAESTLDATMRTGVYRGSHTRAAQNPFPSHDVVGREMQANRPVVLSLAPPPTSTTAPAQRCAASSESSASGNTSTNSGQPSRSNQNRR